MRSLLGGSAIPAALLLSVPALAQPGDWGQPNWGQSGWGQSNGNRSAPMETRSATDSREGKVDVSSFRAEGPEAAALGHGPVSVTAAPGSTDNSLQNAIFEAAVVDQLAKAGYNTATGAGTESGQIAEIHMIRDVAQPEEAPHRPVSGEMTVGTSNHGSMTGMALNIDMTKPKRALLSTRLEVRIRDRATNTALWEGRATILTREGDSHWTDQAIASRLAAALFDRFPAQSS